MKVTVSAPGKLMIMGEHAVVYNRPCIVTAVGLRFFEEIHETSDNYFSLEALEMGISSYKKPMGEIGKGKMPKGALFIETTIKNFAKKYPLRTGFKIKTKSEISKYGLGCSSASAVCMVFGLSEILKLKLTKKEIFDLAYETILEIQGKGSGFDAAASIFGGTLYFVTGGKVIEELNTDKLPIVVGYSGIKANTTQLINMVSELLLKYPEKVNKIFNKITELVEKGKKALLLKDYVTLGKLMNQNEKLLEELGVGTEKLSALIKAALGAGAWGAKLSGAGGGDCMIALVSEEKREAVKKAIVDVGGEVIDVSTNEEGVKIKELEN